MGRRFRRRPHSGIGLNQGTAMTLTIRRVPGLIA